MQLRVEAEAPDVVLRILRPDCLQDADRHQVLRSGERCANPHRAVELPIVVLGLPFLPAGLVGWDEEGSVVDDGRWREALFERRRIDERLERRTGLPLRLRDMIELVPVEVEAANERVDGPVARAKRDESRLRL